ncbi:MAG: cyclic-phosphate processing receiver domain-containing protein [Planctomycetaceae bacterium]|nr:cyclic-phosphate processing receiver domain-containing protein [Planctomycetaceae bacterium]
MMESTRLCLVILEDNADRRIAMSERLNDRLPQYDVCYFATAAECIDFLHRRLSQVLAIALDHDLDPIPAGTGRLLDAGTGREVADFLASQAPVCPVIVHTTNLPAGEGMVEVLKDAGWPVERVIPYGDLEWISQLWFPTLRSAMSAWTRAEEPVLGLSAPGA